MDPNQAISILIQAAHDAQLRGAFNLQQAGAIIKAIDVLTNQGQPQQEGPKVTGPLAEKVVMEKK